MTQDRYEAFNGYSTAQIIVELENGYDDPVYYAQFLDVLVTVTGSFQMDYNVARGLIHEVQEYRRAFNAYLDRVECGCEACLPEKPHVYCYTCQKFTVTDVPMVCIVCRTSRFRHELNLHVKTVRIAQVSL